jgi:antitoxin CptB
MDVKRKKLRYLSWHRGTKESDMIFGNFADTHLAEMDASALTDYENLMNTTDAELMDWVVQGVVPPKKYATELLQNIIRFIHKGKYQDRN